MGLLAQGSFGNMPNHALTAADPTDAETAAIKASGITKYDHPGRTTKREPSS